MSDQQLIETALSDTSGLPFRIASQRALGGGCINDAYRLEGEDGRPFFVKANQLDFHDSFAAEAAALKELAETNTVRVPQVVAQIQGNSQAYLILEYIDARPSRTGDWQTLGRQLAQLHALPKPYFGWHRDNLIGATPQPNPQTSSWLDFFAEHRLEHQLSLCQSRGYKLPLAAELLKELPTLLADHNVAPSLLHGDLWSGNAAFDSAGSPFIFDPGSYYGDREADLAFTEFFGGFPPEFYQAYNAEFPLAPGYSRRKTLYNLYHCLNHLYLFGASYAHQAEQMTRQLLD
ncbi:fructosamine kinase family protein [Pelagicoccus mobilis]|uniref:Fructosamine kinase family protein n=1 Tax=Pelagicoccus mobilis TaxID=415221 RepID=A0A934VRT7_9BACT|nr:fructosamine kinase family protein [Pelagicoccus mobilis]MBK1878300.1 fructosamine kinase family protein [Pelagicoccus mobilis]